MGNDKVTHHWDQAEELPITFGDVIIDPETGEEKPSETEMVCPEDYCTKQCLDYIFEVNRFQEDKNAWMKEKRAE